jgi:hypothetical protein
MIAVKAKFDGKRVIFPKDFKPPARREVIVVFEDESSSSDEQEREMWLKASEEALKKAWDNEEDDVYNDL